MRRGRLERGRVGSEACGCPRARSRTTTRRRAQVARPGPGERCRDLTEPRDDGGPVRNGGRPQASR
ncbi:MAG: hypothetical protein MZV64_12495 [Ignavibacteriales bacterium]|nr:hypothetical protein [Ignavibacteriales bacterium]